VALRIETVSIDATDPLALGRFWSEALGWEYSTDEDGDVWVEPGDHHPDWGRARPLLLIEVPEAKAVKNRIKAAHFPCLKTLEGFDWTWPEKINRLQIQNLFRLAFVEENANIIFISNVGLGKTHFSIALGHAACPHGYSVLFTSAVDIINTLSAAQATGSLKREMKKYLQPRVLIVDELGYLPIDKQGADALFQIISHRYESGSMVV